VIIGGRQVGVLAYAEPVDRTSNNLQPFGVAMSHRRIRASIKLLATIEGGRITPISSGYRSLLRFEGAEVDFGFELEFDRGIGTGSLAPGETASVGVSFWATSELPSLHPGQKFEIREGTRIVGHGRVVEV
jgi:elongation factor Tu